jgi:hypothetical protein
MHIRNQVLAIMVFHPDDLDHLVIAMINSEIAVLGFLRNDTHNRASWKLNHSYPTANAASPPPAQYPNRQEPSSAPNTVAGAQADSGLLSTGQ